MFEHFNPRSCPKTQLPALHPWSSLQKPLTFHRDGISLSLQRHPHSRLVVTFSVFFTIFNIFFFRFQERQEAYTEGLESQLSSIRTSPTAEAMGKHPNDHRSRNTKEHIQSRHPTGHKNTPTQRTTRRSPAKQTPFGRLKTRTIRSHSASQARSGERRESR